MTVKVKVAPEDEEGDGDGDGTVASVDPLRPVTRLFLAAKVLCGFPLEVVLTGDGKTEIRLATDCGRHLLAYSLVMATVVGSVGMCQVWRFRFHFFPFLRPFTATVSTLRACPICPSTGWLVLGSLVSKDGRSYIS